MCVCVCERERERESNSDERGVRGEKERELARATMRDPFKLTESFRPLMMKMTITQVYCTGLRQVTSEQFAFLGSLILVRGW